MTDAFPPHQIAPQGATPEPAIDRASAPPAASPEPHQTSARSEAGQEGIGPFTVRELSIVGVWALAFICSFFPVVHGMPRGAGVSVWNGGIDWVLLIGAPSAAVFLLVLRRFSPSGIPRVGSLGVDQFASVTFSVAAIAWLGMVWNALAVVIAGGTSVLSWVAWVELIAFAALVVLSVAAPWIPVLRDDFAARTEVPAHPNARPVRPVVPRAPRPAQAAPAPASTQTAATAASPAAQPAALPPAFVHPAAPSAVAPSQAEPHASPDAHSALDMHGGIDPTIDFGATDAYRLGDASSAFRPERAEHDLFPGGIVDADAAAPAYARSAGAQAITEREGDSPAETNAVSEATVVSEPTVVSEATAVAGRPGLELDDADRADVAAHQSGWSPVVAPAEATVRQPAAQPFWALAPETRSVRDAANGEELFTIGPAAWALVIEDRGTSFVVRDERGVSGVLSDITGITRA